MGSRNVKRLHENGHACGHTIANYIAHSFKYCRQHAVLVFHTLRESLVSSYVHHTAFFAFLRVGEITICPRSPFALQIEQLVKLEDQAGGILGLKITFRDFKHSYNKGDVSLTLSCRSDICPVQILLDYLSLRGFSNGPLFMTPNGTAVSRHSFTHILSLVFQRCGLDSSKYKGRFRIGAATFAAENGFSDVQIRAMGRWKSDAFRKYIRVPSLSSSSF